MVEMKPKTEEEIIEDEVIEQAKRIWGRPYNKEERPWLDLPYTYCTECYGDDRMLKRQCVCNVVDGTALCAKHWIAHRIKERLALSRERKKVVAKVVLDVDDFARID